MKLCIVTLLQSSGTFLHGNTDSSLAEKIILDETICVLCFMRVLEHFLAENGSQFRRESEFEASILDYSFRVQEQKCAYEFLASFIITWDFDGP